MSAITYSDFSGGLDRRLPINVQEASRLWVLRNAYINQGKRITKRPCLVNVVEGLSGSVGLEAINGRLTVFIAKGASYTPPAGVDVIELNVYNPAEVPTEFLGVLYADVFQGFAYVIAEYYTQTPDPDTGILAYRRVRRHHWVDGSPSTLIADSNCPHSASVTKAASRVFAIGGEVVRYCAAGDARDWTTSSDAGFLATGTQQDTRADCTAVGTFQDALVVFFPEGAQIWDVAVDPSANAIRKRIDGVGCQEPYTLAKWSSDLGFLSPFGFRSMTVTEVSDRIDDTDVGVQIDKLVLPDLATNAALDQNTKVPTFGIWIPQFGQYWCVFDMGATSKVWAFTYSKTSKVACWSEYTLPVQITGITTNAGKVYARSENVLYEVSAAQFTDDGEPVAVEVQMAFQDAKSPGVLKQVYGGDFVFEGSWNLSFKYDPRDLGKETVPMLLTGDTRPGDITPIEICVAAVAPVFRHQADEAAEVSAVSLYYNLLGIQG